MVEDEDLGRPPEPCPPHTDIALERVDDLLDERRLVVGALRGVMSGCVKVDWVMICKVEASVHGTDRGWWNVVCAGRVDFHERREGVAALKKLDDLRRRTLLLAFRPATELLLRDRLDAETRKRVVRGVKGKGALAAESEARTVDVREDERAIEHAREEPELVQVDLRLCLLFHPRRKAKGSASRSH